MLLPLILNFVSCPRQEAETHAHTPAVRRLHRFLQSDAKGSQSFCSHDFNSQQLTRQNPRKPRASSAQVARKHKKPQQLSRMSLAARFKQWIGSRNMHSPSFRLCPSCGRACYSCLWQEYVAGLEFLGATSAGCVGCSVNGKHTA